MKGSSEQALLKPQIFTPHFLLSSDWLLLTNNKTFCYYNHDPKYYRNSPLDPKIQDKKIIYHILRTQSYKHAFGLPRTGSPRPRVTTQAVS